MLSDTHGNFPLAFKALEKAGRVDRIFHLGDGVDDARIIEEITGYGIIKVSGNCDLSASEPREIMTEYAGKLIFATHGDTFNVKSGLTPLHRKAVSENAQIVLYGHTHIGFTGLLGDILFVNPGCLRYRWPNPSYALVTVNAGIASASLFSAGP